MDMTSKINIDIKDIKTAILSPYPTTIRRSVILNHIISVDHSVNKWLYERWVNSSTADRELGALHEDMAQTISDYLENPDLEITFVHLDPRTARHARASY